MKGPPQAVTGLPDAAERDFLASYDASRFARPSLAVDVVVLTVTERKLAALLVRRTEHPALGRFATPGGFVGLDESLDDAAARVLATKAGLRGIFLEQLYTFGAVDRDPRTRVVSVAYYALIDVDRLWPSIARDGDTVLATLGVPWPDEAGGPVAALDAEDGHLGLAFDHAEILGTAVKRIRGKLDYAPIGFQLLPERFTLRQLQSVHETVRGRTLNKDSFRRRMLASGQLEATGIQEGLVGHRPAELYRFAQRSAI